mgnify:CR=1 FL=1
MKPDPALADLDVQGYADLLESRLLAFNRPDEGSKLAAMDIFDRTVMQWTPAHRWWYWFFEGLSPAARIRFQHAIGEVFTRIRPSSFPLQAFDELAVVAANSAALQAVPAMVRVVADGGEWSRGSMRPLAAVLADWLGSVHATESLDAALARRADLPAGAVLVTAGGDLHTLVVAELYPWPAVDGYRQRLHHVIGGLAQAGSVDVVAPLRPGMADPEPPGHPEVLRTLTVPMGDAAGPRSWLGDWFGAGVPRRLLALDWSELVSSLAEWRTDYDLVWYSHVDAWLPTHELLSDIPSIVDFDNLENLSMRLRRRIPPRFEPSDGVKGRVGTLARWATSRGFDVVDERRWDDVQRRCASQVDHVVVCSDLDVERSGCPNAVVVANGADAAERVRRDRTSWAGEHPVVVFVGALDYEPNTEAMSWFLRDVWPIVRRGRPDAVLRVVGRGEAQRPGDGVVVMTFVRAGEHVSAGQRILMYHNPAEVWVEANVKETEVARLKLGMPAQVRVDAFPGEVFKGEIERIGDAATSKFALLPNPNPSGNFTRVTQRLPLRIRLADKASRLKPGMLVEVDVDTRHP